MTCKHTLLWLFLAVVFSEVTVAYADWQYTKWGMSASEIVAASGGQARALRPEEQPGKSGKNFTGIAVGAYQTGPFEFDVSFNAKRGQDTLHTVQLILKNPDQYLELSNSLSALYGQGEVLENRESPLNFEQIKLTIEKSQIRWHRTADTIILTQTITRDARDYMVINNWVSLSYSKRLDDVSL